MEEMASKRIEMIKSGFPKGTRIELICMEDPYTELKKGDRGTVDLVDDIGTIHVSWDCGSSLGLVCGEDQFKVVEDESESTTRSAKEAIIFHSEYGRTYRLYTRIDKYAENGNTAIQLFCEDEEDGFLEPYMTLTVNLGPLSKEYAYLDVNHERAGIIKMMKEYKLGENMYIEKRSGFVTYPLYKLNLEEFGKYKI